MAENGFSDQVGVSHYHPALGRSASQPDGLRSDFFPRIFVVVVSDFRLVSRERYRKVWDHYRI